MTSDSKTTTTEDIGNHGVMVTVSDGRLIDSKTIIITVVALEPEEDGGGSLNLWLMSLLVIAFGLRRKRNRSAN